MAQPITIPDGAFIVPVNLSSSHKTVTLPTVSTNQGRIIIFKDMFGNAANSTLRLSTLGLDRIERSNVSSIVLSNTYGAWTFMNDGITNWFLTNAYLNSLFIQNNSFTPLNILGLSLWLDANDPYGNGTLPSNNTVITSWIDKSGSGNNIAGSNSPRWYANPSRMSNSANAYFSGANPTSYNMIAFFVYLDANSPEGCAPIYTANNPAGTDVTGIFPNCGGTTYVQTSGGWATQGATITDITSNIVSLQYSSASNTSNVVVYFNGNLNFTTSSSPFTRTSYTLGRRVNNYMTGNFYETLFYTILPTTLERQEIEGYLAWKWGLQGNLPANHPYKNGAP